MTHRDRAGDPSGHRAGRREAAGPAGHRQGFPTPAPIRPLPVRLRGRNGGFPRLSDGPWLLDGAHGLRCPASPRHALLAESLGKPSLWVIISAPWYKVTEFERRQIQAVRQALDQLYEAENGLAKSASKVQPRTKLSSTSHA